MQPSKDYLLKVDQRQHLTDKSFQRHGLGYSLCFLKALGCRFHFDFEFGSVTQWQSWWRELCHFSALDWPTSSVREASMQTTFLSYNANVSWALLFLTNLYLYILPQSLCSQFLLSTTTPCLVRLRDHALRNSANAAISILPKAVKPNEG